MALQRKRHYAQRARWLMAIDISTQRCIPVQNPGYATAKKPLVFLSYTTILYQ